MLDYVCFACIININYLKFFYSKSPVPFSTINFQGGTGQPLHSDYNHFGTLTELYLAGAWFALEKVDKFNGPLVIVPGSHKLSIIDFSILNLIGYFFNLFFIYI